MAYNFHRVAFSLHERDRSLPMKWWRGDGFVCRMLGIEEEHLDDFVMRISKGYSGIADAKVYNHEPFNVPIDLKEQGNGLGMHYAYFGR